MKVGFFQSELQFITEICLILFIAVQSFLRYCKQKHYISPLNLYGISHESSD